MIRSGTTVLVAITLAGSPPARAERVCVETLASLPSPVSNNAVTAVDNGDDTFTLYSFMGITNPFNFTTITPAAHRLDWPGGTWTPIADAPLLGGKAKIGANAVVVSGEVYLLGGYTVGGGEVTEPRLFRYDPELDAYVQRASVPVEVDDTVTGVYQDRYLYLVSGWHGPFNRNVPNVQVYDTQDDTWAQATAIPAPLPGLFGHAGTITGDRIIYLDGARSTGNFPITDRVFVGRIDPLGAGDITTIDWQEVAAHPGAATYRAAASQGPTPDGRMLLFGGADNTYNISGNGYNGIPASPLAQLLTYDAIADVWTSLEAYGPHEPTMDHRGLVRVGDGWATIGGMTAPGATTDATYLMRIVADAPGDIDCDGAVTFADLLQVLASWGPCPPPPAWCPADLDDDGMVGFGDVLILLANWG